MKRRFGQFITVCGLVALVLFFISDYQQQPDYRLFFVGFPLLVLGIVILRRSPVQRTESGRFRLFKRAGPKEKSK